MIRRWLWLAVALLLILLAIPGYWVLPGLVRHEHFYHGLPSSYWTSDIRNRIERDERRKAGQFSLLDELGSLASRGTKPSVLRGDPAAVPVLIEVLADADPAVRIAAFRALAWAQGWADDFSLTHLAAGRKRQLCSCAEARLFPVDSGEGRFLILADIYCGLLMGGSVQSVYLLDKNGNLLDSVSCELDIGGRGLRGPKYQSRVERDGAQILVGFVPDEGINYAGCTLEIVQAGRTYVYNWGPDWPRWHKDGICRLVVRQDKLQILFPEPAKAVEVH
jgi:hypothetical protein